MTTLAAGEQTRSWLVARNLADTTEGTLQKGMNNSKAVCGGGKRWTPEEDARLCALAPPRTPGGLGFNWVAITARYNESSVCHKRTAKSVRNRVIRLHNRKTGKAKRAFVGVS